MKYSNEKGARRPRYLGGVSMLLALCSRVDGFMCTLSRRPFVATTPRTPFVRPSSVAWKLATKPNSSPDDFLDVEFERTGDGWERRPRNSTTSGATAVEEPKKKSKKKKLNDGVAKQKIEDIYGKSLLDVSLDADPEWKEMRIPFLDAKRQSVIDGKLAFMVELEGVNYGIATPFDYAAAITVEEPDGKVVSLSPDNDDNEEIMEIMASHLQEQLGEDLSLKRTPKVLTIAGDLGQYTNDWENEILPQPVDTEELLDESDETLDFFHEFMKRELGEKEYEKTMNEPATADSIPDEIMELFDVPGIGEREGDKEGLDKMLKTMISEEALQAGLESLGEGSNHDGSALKLISFNFENGKSYSLVQLLKPFAMVGKYVDSDERVRFELLSAEEEKVVVPKLEAICQKDLNDAGLNLAP